MTNGPGIEAGALWMGVNYRANVFSGVEKELQRKTGCRETGSPSVKGPTLVHEFPPASVSALQIELD